MTDGTDALLAEMLDVQRRLLAAHEASLAIQQESIARQRRVIRQTAPLFVLLVIVAVGPYLWSLVAYLLNR